LFFSIFFAAIAFTTFMGYQRLTSHEHQSIDQALEPLVLKKPSSLEVLVEMTANYLLRRNPPRCC
jgi:hypothetical protein